MSTPESVAIEDLTWDRKRLGDYIVERTAAVWSEKKEPYLISYAPKELRIKGVEYKSILGPLKLKSFIKKDLSGRVNIITHSVHEAKIGTVPVGVTYRFPDDHLAVVEGTVAAAGQRAILTFVDAIANMEDSALEDWSIPALVLKRMANPE